MTTVVVQIGNSDDKLTQQEWSHFCDYVDEYIHLYASKIYFSGYSDPKEEWQNAAWIFEIPYNQFHRPTSEEKLSLWEGLEKACKWFKQDSIAWTEGTTEFITPSI